MWLRSSGKQHPLAFRLLYCNTTPTKFFAASWRSNVPTDDFNNKDDKKQFSTNWTLLHTEHQFVKYKKTSTQKLQLGYIDALRKCCLCCLCCSLKSYVNRRICQLDASENQIINSLTNINICFCFILNELRACCVCSSWLWTLGLKQRLREQ